MLKRALLILALAASNLPAQNDPAPRFDAYHEPLPPGALVRIGHADFGNPVECIGSRAGLAWSPDGKRLITTSDEGAIVIWDVATKRPVKVLSKTDRQPNHKYGIAAFSTDSREAFVCTEAGKLTHWDIDSGKLLQELDTHQSTVTSLAASPDGTTVVSASSGGGICLWHLPDLRKLDPIADPDEIVASLAFDSTGKLLATGGLGGIIHLWEVDTGKEVATLKGHSVANSLMFSPDGKSILSGSFDHSVRTWDIESRKVTAKSKFTRGARFALTWGKGGTQVAGAEGGSVEIASKSGGKPWSARLLNGELEFMAWSPSGDALAVATGDGAEIAVWKSESLANPDDFSNPLEYPRWLGLSPDGKTLATGGLTDRVAIWSLDPVKLQRVVKTGSFDVHDVTILDSDLRVLVLTHPGIPQMIDGKSATPLFTDRADFLRVMAHCPTTGLVAFGDMYGELRLWQADEKSPGSRSAKTKHSIDDIAVSSDGGSVLTSSADGTLTFWDPATCKVVSTLHVADPAPRGVAFVSGGKCVAVASDDGVIRILEISTGKELRALKGEGRDSPAEPHYPLAASPSADVLASGGGDGTVRLWDVSTGACLKTLAAHSSTILCLKFSVDGKKLVSSSDDETALIWDVPSLLGDRK